MSACWSARLTSADRVDFVPKAESLPNKPSQRLALQGGYDATLQYLSARPAADQATHLVPSSEMPLPGTIMCTCGWWVSAEPQVWSTDKTPTRAPRCLGSVAIVINVSAEALNRRS